MRLLVPVLLVLLLHGSAVQESHSEQAYVIAHVEDSVDQLAARAVLEEAYRRLDMKVEFRAMPAVQALEASNGGKVAAELQRIDGIQRRYPNLVQVPIPINYIQGLAFSRDYNFPIRGWHSLRPHRVGIVKGILFAERGTAGMQVSVAKNHAELVEWIRDEKVDVGVMPRISGLLAIKKSGASKIKELKGVLETLMLYHYVHKSNADVAKRLGPVLKSMLLDGTTRRLRAQAYDKILGRAK